MSAGTNSISGTSSSVLSKIHDNTVSGNGGGIYIVGGTCTIGAYTNIYSNSATSNGGGVYVSNGTFNLNGTTANIYSNTANNGGGVYLSAGKFNFTNGRIYSNTATTNGGGVYCTGGGLNTTVNSYIGLSGNPNKAKYGGGLYLNVGWTTSAVKINYNETTNNGNGGGVFVNAGTFTVNNANVQILGNKATGGYGGGVYLTNSSKLAMSAGTIGANTSTHGAGVAVGLCTICAYGR